LNLRDAVELIAASQGPGRYICPKCCGGGDGELSLSIRTDEGGGIHWKCFRASCGTVGGPRGTASVFSGPRREARYYTRPISGLLPAQDDLIEQKFGLPTGVVTGYSSHDDRFILDVCGPGRTYNRRGVVAYSFNAIPKALTYNEKPDEPFIHYAKSAMPRMMPLPIVIVEDWFSAEKVAQTNAAIGVAIMGTHLGQAEITEIVTQAKERVYVALDRDAYTKTLLYLSKYREQFPKGLYAWSLVEDLKYVSVGRIRRAIDGETDFTSDDKRQGNV
jgi:hypothetical protein